MLYRWHDLSTYNGECARGLVHTPEWQEQMAAEQAAFDAEQVQKALDRGAVPLPDGGFLLIEPPPPERPSAADYERVPMINAGLAVGLFAVALFAMFALLAIVTALAS